MTNDRAGSARDVALAALVEAYESAGARGLCSEGRWEAAVGALHELESRAGAGSVVELDLAAIRHELERRGLEGLHAHDPVAGDA